MRPLEESQRGEPGENNADIARGYWRLQAEEQECQMQVLGDAEQEMRACVLDSTPSCAFAETLQVPRCGLLLCWLC